ncbi:hypothetical protein BN59_02364 [Legionella massiliensis]|uniref:Uncharacterized protein n=1 Tax=Legionella massiliensis TaxID=1034943 RepID=A0A078KYD0_9GAMM|nr:hypothetical protein [Legionella massiliensis]CDZ78067.1 hypothetical protein BN59_02364 [Legionella massiliensis]CEE13805.1 hypothetical protein BN1094_02364 [Legionella massiliensis]
MEHLRYTATDQKHKKPDKALFSYQFIAFAFLLVLALLLYLFPGKALFNNLIEQSYISEADFRYSILLLNSDGYNEIVENPAAIIKQFNDDADKQDSESLWLQYIILKYISYQPKLPKEIKLQAEQALAHYLSILQTIPTTVDEEFILARDALAVDQAPLALNFYQQIIEKNPKQDIEFYVQAARVALWAKQCVQSADYYFMAQSMAKTVDDKRYLFITAIKLLFECNKYEEAITAAEKHIDGLQSDQLTYQILTELAVRADKPAKAQDFVLRLLQLRSGIANSNELIINKNLYYEIRNILERIWGYILSHSPFTD